jgi:hypothetical protein
MSALGQKQTLRHLQPMSALPQKRTLELSREMSALRQKRTHAPQQTVLLFDYLISAAEQWQRHRDAERLGGLEVDSEFNLGRLHNR